MYESKASAASPQPLAGPFWWRIWPFGARRRRHEIVAGLYAQIVARARRPEDFHNSGLLDSADNRREWLGCWAALVMIRLHAANPGGAELAQALFDHAFADLEQNFREQGVADMSIGKHVKRAAATFLARYRVIETAITGGDGEPLAASLRRHMAFASEEGDGPHRLSSALLAAAPLLAACPDQSALLGELDLQRT